MYHFIIKKIKETKERGWGAWVGGGGVVGGEGWGPKPYTSTLGLATEA